MPFIFIHTDDPKLPRTLGISHQGFYEFPQGDGTHIIAMRCDHIGTARHAITTGAAAAGVRAHQFPSRASGGTVHDETLASLRHHLSLDASITALTTTQALSGLSVRWWNHPALCIEDVP